MYNLVNTGKDKQTGLEKSWLPLEIVIKASFRLYRKKSGKKKGIKTAVFKKWGVDTLPPL